MSIADTFYNDPARSDSGLKCAQKMWLQPRNGNLGTCNVRVLVFGQCYFGFRFRYIMS
jgi:hypothetical protein